MLTYNELHTILSEQLLSYHQCFISTVVSSSQSHKYCSLPHSPLTSAAYLCIAVILYSFIWGEISFNYSKVDQIWSIVPLAYSLCFYASTQSQHHRLSLICALITAWGVRLTCNFYRRGGYGNLLDHLEDHRWAVLKSYVNNNRVILIIFNATFICIYQNILLLLITLPLYDVILGPSRIGILDVVVSVAFAVCLIVESIADNQQWNFHQKKHLYALGKLSNPSTDVSQGFIQTGLFKYSRHPNFFCEQCMWVCVYLFSITNAASIQDTIRFSGIGCVLLILLFQGSTNFTELITMSKYGGAYVEYKKRTSQLLPWFPFHQDEHDKTK